LFLITKTIFFAIYVHIQFVATVFMTTLYFNKMHVCSINSTDFTTAPPAVKPNLISARQTNHALIRQEYFIESTSNHDLEHNQQCNFSNNSKHSEPRFRVASPVPVQPQLASFIPAQLRFALIPSVEVYHGEVVTVGDTVIVAVLKPQSFTFAITISFCSKYPSVLRQVVGDDPLGAMVGDGAVLVSWKERHGSGCDQNAKVVNLVRFFREVL
jgi:hypothetical protein